MNHDPAEMFRPMGELRHTRDERVCSDLYTWADGDIEPGRSDCVVASLEAIRSEAPDRVAFGLAERLASGSEYL